MKFFLILSFLLVSVYAVEDIEFVFGNEPLNEEVYQSKDDENYNLYERYPSEELTKEDLQPRVDEETNFSVQNHEEESIPQAKPQPYNIYVEEDLDIEDIYDDGNYDSSFYDEEPYSIEDIEADDIEFHYKSNDNKRVQGSGLRAKEVESRRNLPTYPSRISEKLTRMQENYEVHDRMTHRRDFVPAEAYRPSNDLPTYQPTNLPTNKPTKFNTTNNIDTLSKKDPIKPQFNYYESDYGPKVKDGYKVERVYASDEIKYEKPIKPIVVTPKKVDKKVQSSGFRVNKVEEVSEKSVFQKETKPVNLPVYQPTNLQTKKPLLNLESEKMIKKAIYSLIKKVKALDLNQKDLQTYTDDIASQAYSLKQNVSNVEGTVNNLYEKVDQVKINSIPKTSLTIQSKPSTSLAPTIVKPLKKQTIRPVVASPYNNASIVEDVEYDYADKDGFYSKEKTLSRKERIHKQYINAFRPEKKEDKIRYYDYNKNKDFQANYSHLEPPFVKLNNQGEYKANKHIKVYAFSNDKNYLIDEIVAGSKFKLEECDGCDNMLFRKLQDIEGYIKNR